MNVNTFSIINTIIIVFLAIVVIGFFPVSDTPDPNCIVTPSTHNVSLYPNQSVDVSTKVVCSSPSGISDITPDTSNCGEIIINDFGGQFTSSDGSSLTHNFVDTHQIRYEGDGTVETVTCKIVWTGISSQMPSTIQTITITIMDESEIPRVSILKTGPAEVVEGDTISYLFEIQNIGSIEIFDCVVYDQMLGFNKTVGILQPGQQHQFEFSTILEEDTTNIASIICISSNGIVAEASDEHMTSVNDQ